MWHHQDHIIRIGVVEKFTETDYKNNSYEALRIAESYKQPVQALLKSYYLDFTETKVRSQIATIIQKNFVAASKLLGALKQFPDNPIVTVATGYLDSEAAELVKDLANAGLAFLVGYTSASGQTHYEEIVFRERPIAVKAAFTEQLEQELKRRLLALSDPEKWCIYLRHINPSATQEFFVLNKGEFTREEMLSALGRIPHIQQDKQSEVRGL